MNLDTYNPIDDYFGLETLAPVEGKPEEKKKREPLPKCPRKDTITVAQFQIFDNGPNPGRGRSQHVLKLEIYHRGWGVKLHDPDWWRDIQLIDPKLVVAWAEKRHASGEMTADMLELYQGAEADADAYMANDPNAVWAKLGHIGAKRENTYYPGQFAYVSFCRLKGPAAIVFIDGEALPCERLIKDKRRRAAGARTHFGFYDPGQILLMQREEQRKLVELRQSRGEA